MPNLTCVAGVVGRIAGAGLKVHHLISVGGWNAPHPDDSVRPAAAWAAWREWNSRAADPALGFGGFDGIDWDLEGDSHPERPANRFSIHTLDLIGRVSQARARPPQAAARACKPDGKLARLCRREHRCIKQ